MIESCPQVLVDPMLPRLPSVQAGDQKKTRSKFIWLLTNCLELLSEIEQFVAKNVFQRCAKIQLCYWELLLWNKVSISFTHWDNSFAR